MLRPPFARFMVRAALPALAVLASAPASAVLLLNDQNKPEIEADFRPGHLLPDAAQLARVANLKARANWNRFGTVHSMIAKNGYLATGYSGSPVEGARNWIMDNRELFKLSEAGVQDLELVNEGVMPHTDARAVLFRQRFGGLHVTHDGLITVGIVNGKVYYVSSSSAGDQPPAGVVKIGALDAWLKAAADVHRKAVPKDVLLQRDATEQTGWHLFDVLGFAQPQRARLVAIPIPAGGVRQAWETVVLDMQNGASMAYVHFIDAETGAVLRRENRLQNFADTGTPDQVVSDALVNGAACSVRHNFAVDQTSEARFNASSVSPGNVFTVNLYRDGRKLASQSMTGNGVLRYAPAGGVAAGTYQLEMCPENKAGAHFLPPYNYVIAKSSGPEAPAPIVYNAAKWRWFPAEPLLTLESTDTRKIACFGPMEDGCDYDFTSVAARQAWDMLAGAVPTFTSIGNSAITQESPYTAVIAGAPFVRVMQPSPLRNYDYAWTNNWYESSCLPVYSAGAVAPAGNINDIDATIADMFVAHNRMHDWAYLLGFTERNYNMQLSNFGQTDVDVQNDPELGMAQATGPTGGYPLYLGRSNANQATLQDGVPGLTQQYLFQTIAGAFYAPCTDGAFSMTIVAHEFTHAISNRMIGGPDQGIGGQQGGSMGESWSDLAALEHMYETGLLQGLEDPTTMATYVSGGVGTGFRDYALERNPLNYGNLGFDTPGPEVHADGEIWNGTQWGSVRKAFIDKYNDQYPYDDMKLQWRCSTADVSPEGCPGNRRWVQTLFDAFLLMPASPSMLDARDAQLAADLARFNGADLPEMWAAFAQRGMGISAFSFDGSDTAPIPGFDTPLGDNSNVSFTATDSSGKTIANAVLYVGQFTARTRYVADTDPVTVEPDTFAMVAGTYDFVVAAPGYGMHRFNRTISGASVKLEFQLPTNWASLNNGATAVSSATVQANIDLTDTTIDDSEETGAIIGDAGLVAGATLTVALAGGEQTISRINVSTTAGPDNPGRFTPVRSFEIRVCSGECSDPQADFETVAYTSPEDAFPTKKARPLQPNLIFKSFDFPAVKATHVQLRVLTSQCTGNPEYAGEQDADPLNGTDCTTTPPPPDVLSLDPTVLITPGDPAGTRVRLTDFEVFTEAAVDKSADAPKSLAARFGGSLPLASLLVLALGGALRRRRRH